MDFSFRISEFVCPGSVFSGTPCAIILIPRKKSLARFFSNVRDEKVLRAWYIRQYSYISI